MMLHRIRPIAFLALLFLLAAGFANGQSCDNVINTAQAEYNRGQYASVIDQLRACLRSGTMTGAEHGLSYRLIAMSHLEIGQRTEAAEAVRRMLDNSPYYRVNPETDSRSFIELVQAENRRRARTARSMYLQEMEPFRFNVGLHGAFLSGNKLDGMHAGGVASIGISYFLSPQIGVDAVSKFGILSSEYYSLLEFSLGARYVFTASSRFAPYVGVGGIYRSTSRIETVPVQINEDEIEDIPMFFDVNGYGGTAYGGVLMALTPSFALDFQASGAIGSLNNALLREPVAGMTGFVGVGLVWAPIYR